MDIEAYFERIGYKNSRKNLDLETLTDILQHHIRAVPFENLNIHCGETMEFGLQAIFDQVVRKNRGGWCLQVNQLLYWALRTIGFETTTFGGYVYIPEIDQYSSNMIHLVLQVTIGSKKYIVDAGFGFSFQMWQPLELISGQDQPQVPCIFRLREESGTWYLDQIRREQHVPNEEFLNSELLEKNKYRKMYSFTLEPQAIENFEPVNTYMQESPTSVFKTTSLCSLQTPEGVHGLVGFTLISKRFNYKDNIDLVDIKTLDEKEVEEVLKNIFNISLERKFVPKHGGLFINI
ncbi:arylamine N-acetyltransferase 1-like [Microcebus murinus]|uniref:arylamine N-acetyltransferase 1-like n=1 Tax=Microcebus murinus TaxID=30608 RepID=UPI000642956D|nr:arylamine N-acetyltransferase 1-like [Microcebus murinus]XP_012640489.1 arylamine N-acetyltransferase 1-like [Microcebus murinus]XP_012640490.1 arylamine N-acetyltransferase 1-like [Microcebus murinus]XP_012640491.1 arylamine N-acetyltransferase 1-like [Microcebus murinus]XP_012640492.1 arylamine N-acetyltransferase 1-like [Microcebus murinus]XP_012640493.1 arylamine N-acetyltransferase 1-like [Microcebus murinus]XP_012640494.1 arylamine N-acetyltransferase 1-like [Microcebus murinus]XP_0